MKNFKKLSALFLALVMIIGLIPINTFASNAVLKGTEADKIESINTEENNPEDKNILSKETLEDSKKELDIPDYSKINIVDGKTIDNTNPKTEKYTLHSKKFDFSNFGPKGKYSKGKYRVYEGIINKMFSMTPLSCVGTVLGKTTPENDKATLEGDKTTLEGDKTTLENGKSYFIPYQLENWYYRTVDSKGNDDKVAYCLNLGRREPHNIEMTYSPEKNKLNTEEKKNILNVLNNAYPTKEMFEKSDTENKDRNDLFEYITAIAVKIAQGELYSSVEKKETLLEGLTKEMLSEKMYTFDPNECKFAGEDEEPELAIIPTYLSTIAYKKAFDDVLTEEDRNALRERNDFIITQVKEILKHQEDDLPKITEEFTGDNDLILGKISGPYRIKLLHGNILDEINFEIENKNNDINLSFFDKNKKEIDKNDIENDEDFYIKADYIGKDKIQEDEAIKILAYTKKKNILTNVFYSPSPEQNKPDKYGLTIQNMYVAENIGLTVRKTINIKEPIFNISIFKYEENSEDKIPVVNAKIKIYEDYKDKDEKLTKEVADIGELPSNAFGEFKTSLKAGTYYFKETSAPEGYIFDDTPHKLVIKEAKNELGFTIEGNKFYNKKKPQEPPKPEEPKDKNLEVAFGKYDIADGSKIVEGAKLEIFKYNENSKQYDILVKTIITDKKNAKDFKVLLEPGKYLFKETVAPNGYVLSKDECKFEVKYKEDGKTLEIVDSEGSRKIGNKPSSITIEKLDSLTRKAINGVKFDIYKDGEIYKKDLVTSSDQAIKLDYLQHGKYKIIETYTPAGYILDKTEREFTVDNNGNVSIDKMVIENTPIADKITKVDKDTGKALPGVKFQFFGSDKTSFEKTTDQNGQIDLSGLSVGEYTFIELEAPNGYEKSTNIYKVNILPNGTLAGDIRVENSLIKYDFTLTKVSTKNERLYGAKFEIRDSKDNLVKIIESDSNGLAVLKDLTPDTYSIKELEAPKGFIKSDKTYKVTIDKDGMVTGDTVITNEDTFVELTKENEKGEKLADAEFEIKDINNKLLAKAKTDRDGKITIRRLPAGNKYYIKEIKAPKGYLLDSKDYEIKISEDGKVTGTTTFVNKKSEIVLRKRAKDTRDYLEGAKFKLKDSRGKTIKDVESDRRGEIIIEGLEPGDYSLEEYEAPEGYLVSEKAFKFTVSQDGKLQGKDIIYNEEARFTLVKKDLTTGAVLEGASFTIKDKNDRVVARITTNKNGEAEVTGLGEGRYSLEEIVAPQGYAKPTKSVSFSVDKNGKIDGKDTLEVFNKQEAKKVTPIVPDTPIETTPNIPNNYINNETKVFDKPIDNIVTSPVEKNNVPVEHVKTGDEVQSKKSGWVLLILMLVLAVVVCILYFLSKRKDKNNKKIKK